VQAASSFATSFSFLFGPDKAQAAKVPCLIPCAVDQDPYFRLTRDVASQLGYAKSSLIDAKFLDALQGPGSKMSASVASSSIFVRDTPKQIFDKIKRHAFSGGRETLEAHWAEGGDPDVDVSYQYLRFFLEVCVCPVGLIVMLTSAPGRRRTRAHRAGLHLWEDDNWRDQEDVSHPFPHHVGDKLMLTGKDVQPN
jgi:hypothetical protein